LAEYVIQLSELLLSATTHNTSTTGLQMFLRKIGNEGHIDFFHRQIAKAVVKKYLESDSVRVAYHTKLAQYYGRQADPTSSFNFTIDGNGLFSHMKDVKWMLTAISSPENAPRAISELPYHLLKSNRWEDLLKTLCNLGFIHRKAKYVAEE